MVWVFVYKLSGCEIGSRCSYLNFRYCTCLEQRAPWQPGKYKMYAHSKTRMLHDKNTQLKTFLPLHTVSLNYFIYSRVLRHLRFYIVGQFQLRLEGSKRFLFIWSEKSFLSFKLFTIDPQEKPCLPNWFEVIKKYFRLHLSHSEDQKVTVKRLTSSFG